MKRKIALVSLMALTLGLAYVIEVMARPSTGRQGVRVEGQTQAHDH